MENFSFTLYPDVCICMYCNKYTTWEIMCFECSFITNVLRFSMDHERSSYYGTTRDELLKKYNIASDEDQDKLKIIYKAKDLEKIKKHYGTDIQKVKEELSLCLEQIEALENSKDILNKKIFKIRKNISHLKFLHEIIKGI